MEPWKFGIVGAGLIADFHARAIGDISNTRLTGVIDKDPERARNLAKKYNTRSFEELEALLAEVNIITIATPSGIHADAAIAAAKAGVNVLCEKPLDITLERIDAMIDAHKKAGTMLGGIFQNRFNPALEPLRQAIEHGRFGNISFAGVYVPWWREDEYYKNSWHGTLDMDGGGALMNQSIHMIDMLVDLMGLPESVQGFVDSLGHNIEAEDTGVAALKFPNGALGLIYGTTASWPGQFKRFEITGTKGTVVYLEDSFPVWKFAAETEEDDRIRAQFGSAPSDTGGGVADPAAISHTGHTRNIESFINALEGGDQFQIDGVEARKSVELILAIYESSRQGKLIKLG